MVAIFATATALLTPEFVESFDPEKLASKFVKVEKEYGVKFSKASRTFNIVGHWEAVRNAHRSLQNLKAEGEDLDEVSPVKIEKDEIGEARDEDGETDQPDSPIGTEQSVYKIKGNPKRGRYTAETSKPGGVPDPLIYFQYQDRSFSDQDKVNIDAMLDEFERAQRNKKVTKEDLKKILEKNTEQMGRPLNKGLPRGASLPRGKSHPITLSQSSEHQFPSSSQTVLSTLTSPLDSLQSQPEMITSMTGPNPHFTLVQPGPVGYAATGVDSSSIPMYQSQERFVGNFQSTGVNDVSWLSYNSQGYPCISSEAANPGQVMDGSIVNIVELPSLPLAVGPETGVEGATKTLLDVSSQLAPALIDTSCVPQPVTSSYLTTVPVVPSLIATQTMMTQSPSTSATCGLYQVTAYTASTTSSAGQLQLTTAPVQHSTGHTCTQSTSSTGQLQLTTAPVQHSTGHNCAQPTSSTGQLQLTTAPVQHSTGHNCTQPTSSAGQLQLTTAPVQHSTGHNCTQPTSNTGQLQITTAPVQYSTAHNWTQQTYGQPEQPDEIKRSPEIPVVVCLVSDEGKLQHQEETELKGEEPVAMETTISDVTTDIKSTVQMEIVPKLSAGTTDSTVEDSKEQTQCEIKEEKKPVKAKRKRLPSKPTKGNKGDQSAGQTVSQTFGQTVSQTVEQTVSQTTEKNVSHTVENITVKADDLETKETAKKSRSTKAAPRKRAPPKKKAAAKPSHPDPGKSAEAVANVSVDSTEDKHQGETAAADKTAAVTQTATKEKPSKAKKEPKVYRCTECDYKGCRKKRLTEHMGRVHGLLTENCRGTQEKTTFPCDMCDKSFVFGKDLNRHKKIVHHGQVHFCNICQKSYKSKYVFDKHMTTHEEGYVQPMFPCKVCERQFTTKFSLSCHIKSEHLGLKKTFLCPTCGKSFSQIRSYRQHANVHAGIRPYVCEICGKSFTYDKSLKEHRYMHDNIRRFPCSVCGKAFRQRTCLLIHMKVHKESKDHICSSCGKGFTQKQSLLRHERIHSGDKPYTCKLCQKSFSDYAVIRKHMLMSHKKEKTDWKDDVHAEARKTSDHYIAGGPGYVPREPCTQVREKNYATVIPSKNPGGSTVIISHGEDLKKEDMPATVAPPQLQVSQSDATLYDGVNVMDIRTVQDSPGQPVTDLTSLYQPLAPSMYPGGGYTLPQQSAQEVGMLTQDTTVCIKHPDTEAGIHTTGVPLNYGGLSALPSQAYSVADSGLTSEESMVAAFLKAQGKQPGLGTDIFASLGQLTAASVNSLEPTQRGQSQLTYGLPSAAMTTNVTDPAVTTLEVTTATTNISWGYPGYSSCYNAGSYSQYQSPQQNQ